MIRPLRILIIGGVAGGASAATRARRMNATAEITILEKGPVVSFANCGLPYHLGGEIAQREKLLVATEALFWNRFRIAVKSLHEATEINRETRTVSVRNLQTNELVELPYDRLIIATGSEPNTPEFFQPTLQNVFHLWTLSDMDRVLAFHKNQPVRKAIVIGAGFVGLEVVEQLHRIGIEVTLVERNPQVLTRLDPIFAGMIQEHLESKQVVVQVGVSVESVDSVDGRATVARLSDGREIATDLIIVGAGVRPRIQLAANAGLTIGKKGGVVVNEYTQTNDPNIYAVGDIIEYVNGVTGETGLNALAGPANRSGRIAGEHAASGCSETMGPVLGTSIVRVFDLTAGITGLSERALDAQKIAFRTAIIQAASHASYFPGAQNIQLKILYSPEGGRLLGAQAVGGEGVDKRIDILATLMHFRGTVFDLAKLDLAYAPPFGSAKDPVHMAAFAAINDLKQQPTLALPTQDLSGLQVVDVRTSREREQLPLPTAKAIEIDGFANHLHELDPTAPTVVVCHSGKRAHIGASWLRSSGFQNVRNLTGGMLIRSLALRQKARQNETHSNK